MKKYFICFAFVFVLSKPLFSKTGISTNIVNLFIGKVPVNQEYSLNKSFHRPLKVTNKGDRIIEVVITPKIPEESGLSKDFLQTPDLNWIKIVPDRFRLNPKQANLSDVIITIPDKRKYKGRNYQVNIEISGAATDDKRGLQIVPSLLSKLRFTVDGRKSFLFW